MTQVLKIRIGIGAQNWTWIHGDDNIKSEAIEKAVTRIMVGEKVEEMRSRVKAIAVMGKTCCSRRWIILFRFECSAERIED